MANEPFVYRKANDAQSELIRAFAQQFETLCTAMNSIGSGSREKSLAITNLEQAAMWFNKHIAFNCEGGS